MADTEKLVCGIAKSLVRELGIGLEENPEPYENPENNPLVRKTAKKLAELSEALPGIDVWVSVDDADVWLNFQSGDMEVDNGVRAGTLDEDIRILLLKLQFAADSAIVGSMAGIHIHDAKKT